MAESLGRKDDQNKLARYDLIPVYPLRLLAELYGIGAKKYDDRNWEKGIAWHRVYRALQSHANLWWGGEKLDPDNGQHHLASVAWNAFALMEFERTHPELDTRNLGLGLSKEATEALVKTGLVAPLSPEDWRKLRA